MRYPPAPPPEGPSELIDLAVADARQLDRTRYTPNPYVWHRPADDGACMICVAGSVIAGTLKCPTDKDVEVGEGHGANPDRVTINDKRWQRCGRSMTPGRATGTPHTTPWTHRRRWISSRS